MLAKNLKHENEKSIHEINLKLLIRSKSPILANDIFIINNSMNFDFIVLMSSVDDH